VNLLGAFAGLTHRKNREHRWLYGGSVGPLTIPDNTQQILSDLANRIVQRFDLVGLFNVDFILTPKGQLALLEINPRYSASMELMPTAGHLVDCHIAAYQEHAGLMDTRQTDLRFAAIEQHAGDKPNDSSCKRIVYATRPTHFNSSIDRLRKITRNISDFDTIQVTYHDIPPNDDTIPEGYPILTIIARNRDMTTSPPAKNLIRHTYRIAARIRNSLA
jgi:predicted ATP-grasp superfamily ATP-dependent carboligase